MKENNYYNNYYKTHGYAEQNLSNYDIFLPFFKKNFDYLFNKLDKNINIVEIGSGQGKFAYYCKVKGFKNYIGFDLDPHIVKYTQSKFPSYKFSTENIFEYLKNNSNSIDIIFMSHVFEHFTLDEGFKLSKLINSALKKNGIWINVMPNAQSAYNSGYLRYNDITHKILYTPNSFSQVLLNTGFKKNNIIHKNAFIGYNIIKRIIYKLSIVFHKILFLSIGISFPKIHTMNLISIIKK